MSKKIPVANNAAKSEEPIIESAQEKTKRLRKYFAESVSKAQHHVKLVSAATEPTVKVLYKNPFFKHDSGSIENFVFYEKANEVPVPQPKKRTPKKDPATRTTYHCQYKGCGKALPLVPVGNRCKICNLEFCSVHANPNFHDYKCGDILRGMLLIRAKSVQKLMANQERKKYESEFRSMGTTEFRKKVAERHKYLKFGEHGRKNA